MTLNEYMHQPDPQPLPAGTVKITGDEPEVLLIKTSTSAQCKIYFPTLRYSAWYYINPAVSRTVLLAESTGSMSVFSLLP